MKQIVIFGLCAAMMLGGCSSDESVKDFHVRNCANTGCKERYLTRDNSSISDDSDACWMEVEGIEYKALSGGYLSLNHFNTIFNCAVSQLNAQAVLDGNVIKVLEKTDEPEYLANCVCRFDLYCEVGPLADGDYSIFIYKDSFDNPSYTTFSISYKSGLSGVHSLGQTW